MDDALSALSEAAAAALPAVAHLLPSSIAGHHEQGDDSPTDSSSNSAQPGVKGDMAEVTVKREERAEDKDSKHRDAPASSPSILHHQSSDTALHQREDVRSTATLPVAASSTATSELHSLAANRTDLALESSKKEGQHVNGSLNTIASDPVASASHTGNISSSALNGAPPASFSTRSPEEIFSTNTTSSSTKSVDGDTHSSNLKRKSDGPACAFLSTRHTLPSSLARSVFAFLPKPPSKPIRPSASRLVRFRTSLPKLPIAQEKTDLFCVARVKCARSA